MFDSTHILDRVAFDRLGVIVSDPDAPATPALLGAYVAELARLGVHVANPEALTDSVIDRWPTVHAAASAARGTSRALAPLFDGFPDRLPTVDLAEIRFWVAAARLAFLAAEQTRAGDGDQLVEFAATDTQLRAAMDLSNLGWWPASSVPVDPEMAAIAEDRQLQLRPDSRSLFDTVEVLTPDEATRRLSDWAATCAVSSASLRTEVLADLRVVVAELGDCGVALSDVRFGEIRAVFAAAMFDAARDDVSRAAFVDAGFSPDDVLRMFAVQTGTDVSLSAGVKFPALRRQQRRLVAAALDASPRLRDMFRRRGLWLAATKSLHVGEMAAMFPRLAAVTAELRARRSDPEAIRTRFEQLAGVDPIAAAELAAAESPGLLLRELRRLAASVADTAADRDRFVTAVSAAAGAAPLRAVLGARAQIVDNAATYPRLAVTKTGHAMVIDRPGHLRVDDTFAAAIAAALHDAATVTAAGFGSWDGERVWIDPACAEVLVADQLRSTSDGRLSLERGSRIGVGAADVLRLFVHWCEPEGEWSDLDLSVIAFDAEFRSIGQVSWTNLADGAMTHSGDLTSAPAPLGATEFIDVDLAAVERRAARERWRYLAPAIYRYSGPSFADLPEAFAGWMERVDVAGDVAAFDPSTVRNAVNLTSRKGSVLPFVYDIAERRIVHLDVAMGARYAASTETSSDTAAAAGRALLGRAALKTNVAELAELHANARGASIVTDRGDATVTFSVDADATYDALAPQRILSELL